MSLSLTVARGYTMTPEAKPTIDDWNAGFLPSVVLEGSVGGTDIGDDSLLLTHLSPNFLLGGTVITALAGDDMLLVGDASSADNRVITVANALRSLPGLSTAGSGFNDFANDLVFFWKAETDDPVALTVARFFEQGVAQAPQLTTGTAHTDSTFVYDASEADGSRLKRVTLADLLPDLGAAYTINNPTQIVVDTKGRVVSASATAGSNRYRMSTPLSLPTSAGFANGIEVDTGFGAVPSHVSLWLICTDAGGDAGWVQYDVVPAGWVMFDTPASGYYNGRYGAIPKVGTDAGKVLVVQPADGGGGALTRIARKDTGDDDQFTPSKWKFYLHADL